jgi:hypothetical protein
MAFYVVVATKWNDKGGHSKKIVGITDDLKVAQELMLEKALHLAKWKDHLRGNELYIQPEIYGRERSIRFRDLNNHIQVLEDLIAAKVATSEEIRVVNGDNGFAVKIKIIPFYDASTVAEAPTEWARHFKEKVEKKQRKLQSLALTLPVATAAVAASSASPYSRLSQQRSSISVRDILDNHIDRPLSPRSLDSSLNESRVGDGSLRPRSLDQSGTSQVSERRFSPSRVSERPLRPRSLDQTRTSQVYERRFSPSRVSDRSLSPRSLDNDLNDDTVSPTRTQEIIDRLSELRKNSLSETTVPTVKTPSIKIPTTSIRPISK